MRKINRGTSKGRHPLLRPGTIHNIFFNFIKKNPGCTRQMVKDGTNAAITQTTKRIGELLNQGLVVDGEKIHCSTTGRLVSTLYAVTASEMGEVKQKQSFDLQLWKKFNGEIVVVIKGNRTADCEALLSERRVTFVLENLQTCASKKKLITEGVFTTIEE